MSAQGYWWYSHGEIFRLLRWLEERGDLDTVDAAIRVVEKPWHWDDEYEQMCREDAEARAGDASRDAAIDRAECRSEVAEYEEP